VELYREKKKSATEIGKELKIGYLLEGSVRRAASQVLITAQLIQTKDDRQLWAEDFVKEYSAAGIFEIQKEIAEKIVAGLKLQIAPERIAEITKIQTRSKDAYDHFLKGRQSYEIYNRTSNEKASIEIDPRYAAAYGMLANAFTQRVIGYGFENNWVDSAKVYAQKGIDLDKNCAECYKAMGLLYMFSKIASEYYEKALELNPNYSNAHNNIIQNYLELGDFANALRHINSRYSDATQVTIDLGSLYFYLGDMKTSLEYYEKYIAGYWMYRYAFNSLVQTKDYEKIRMFTEKLYDLNKNEESYLWDLLTYNTIKGDFKKATLIYESKLNSSIPGNINRIWYIVEAYRKSGEIDKAKQLSTVFLQNHFDFHSKGKDMSLAIMKAQLYSVLNEDEKAIESLEKAIDMNYLKTDIAVDESLELLRQHPRFQQLVEKQEKKRAEIFALIAAYHFPKPEEL